MYVCIICNKNNKLNILLLLFLLLYMVKTRKDENKYEKKIIIFLPYVFMRIMKVNYKYKFLKYNMSKIFVCYIAHTRIEI
jgi:hypothetical protein